MPKNYQYKTVREYTLSQGFTKKELNALINKALKSGHAIQRNGGVIIELPPEYMSIDHGYQRGNIGMLENKNVAAIASHWDDSKVGIISANAREIDGKFYIFVWDGRNRCTAAIHADIETVPMYLTIDLTEEEEAGKFVGQNDNRRNIQAAERFTANVRNGKPAYKAIDDVIKKYGYSLNLTGKRNLNGNGYTIGSISQIENQFVQNKSLKDPVGCFDKMLQLIVRSNWGTMQDNTAAYISVAFFNLFKTLEAGMLYDADNQPVDEDTAFARLHATMSNVSPWGFSRYCHLHWGEDTRKDAPKLFAAIAKGELETRDIIPTLEDANYKASKYRTVKK